jgi:hypothetical protein
MDEKVAILALHCEHGKVASRLHSAAPLQQASCRRGKFII